MAGRRVSGGARRGRRVCGPPGARHLVGQDAVDAVVVQADEPVQARQLVLAHRAELDACEEHARERAEGGGAAAQGAARDAQDGCTVSRTWGAAATSAVSIARSSSSSVSLPAFLPLRRRGREVRAEFEGGDSWERCDGPVAAFSLPPGPPGASGAARALRRARTSCRPAGFPLGLLTGSGQRSPSGPSGRRTCPWSAWPGRAEA